MRKRWYSILSVSAIVTGIAAYGLTSASASTNDCLSLGPVCGTNVNTFGNAFDVDHQNFTKNGIIISWPNGNDRATDFIRTSPSAGIFRYEVAPNGVHTGLCVADPDGGVAGDPGGPHGLLERVCNAGNWQRFRVGASGPGGKQLVNVATSRVVTTNGTGKQLTTGGSYTGGSYWTWKGGASPTPTPTATTPTPTPSPTHSGTMCQKTSLDRSECGPYNDPNVKGGSNDGGSTVRQEVWNLQPALHKQVLQAWGPGDWQVTENAAAGNTEVNSYPDVSDTVTRADGTPNPASAYTSMVSTYSENMHANAGTDAEAAYDIWLNDYANELMIWVDNRKQVPAGNDMHKTVTVGGNTYELWQDNGNEVVSLVLDHNAPVGTTDILGIVKALTALGIYANPGFSQVNFGFEAPSTGGIDETFAVTGYTLKYS